MNQFLDSVEFWIGAWHGISAPNERAKRMAIELADVISRFEGQRGTMRFEDEPASFEIALVQAKRRA
ncbi:hypothetical protein [Bradyrhizobium sp. 172]|uniref:hypothetical protein n=1 Tax=Bradyrhizobium sp. 172 TaxID=2782643 RepID=UPI001FFF206E|nr:hypothetical protein [Bradyrhizobium sp. 172]UPJ94923.1 hypothetical protein IVB07_31805 [Bradyrhizobium sp. 172]